MEYCDFDSFFCPPAEYRPRPLWFWNSAGRRLSGIRGEGIREIMTRSVRESRYAGFGILPEWLDGYMSDTYLDLYGQALETARQLGIKMCLYDENGFPSGSAGGLLAEKYPNDTMKRLDKEELEVSGPCAVDFLLRPGKDAQYIGAVLFETNTKKRINISERFLPDAQERLTASFSVPAGQWKIMAFFVRKDGYDRVDYLDQSAVLHLLALTHEAYYKKFSEFFGGIIDSAFYDEPMLYQAKGRTWTGSFNRLFQKRYGFDPITLYPALWYDIGEETVSARNALFGFRTELFSEHYIKAMNDWCNKHGILLTGHMDQEENTNPVYTCGDLMKIFQYQDIPGIDEIMFCDRAIKAYKIVSSAAYNWDKPLVMTEVYGAMGEEMGISVLYKDIMNQFVRGINYVVPHAVWYHDGEGVSFPPELSYRSEKYAAALPAYSDFTARVSLLLRGGRHVADIGVLYPIDSLKAETCFDSCDPYYGNKPAGIDYMELGHWLVTELRRDFTFLHPETLADRCTADGGSLTLQNPVNWETYRVLIIPGGSTISVRVMQKVKDFYDCGGRVIFTSRLPEQAAEPGFDPVVRKLVRSILENSSDSAGKAAFVAEADYGGLAAVLSEFLKLPDVALDAPAPLPGGSLGYLHKQKKNRNIYYLANSSEQAVSCPVTLRGKIKDPWFWDPHTGTRSQADCFYSEKNGISVTAVTLELPPVRSIFLIENGG